MKLLPLAIFWGLLFLSYSARTTLAPILPLIEDSLHLSHGQAGGLFTSLAMGNSLSLLIAGRFASVWGYKRTVVASMVGISIVLFSLQWVERYAAFHVVFFLVGFSAGGYYPAIMPILTETYGSNHWGKVLGLHDSAASFSVFAVPLLVTLGLHFISWKGLLLILGMAAFLIPVGFWKVAIEPKPVRSLQRSRTLPLLKKRSVCVMAFIWMFMSASGFGLFSILPLYLIKERGLGFDYANTLIGICGASGVFVTILSGFLVDRYGYRKMLILSLLATGLSTVALALAPNLQYLVVALVVQATSPNVFFPAGLAAITRLNALSDRAMAAGLIFFFGATFGCGVSPLILGYTADHLSFRAGLLGLGVLTSASPLALRLLKEVHS